MRRSLLSLIFATLLVFLAVPSAQAASFECSCATSVEPGSCNVTKTIDAADLATAQTQCVTECSGRSQFMCSIKEAGSGQGGDRTVRLVNPLNTSNVPQLVSNIIKAAVGTVGAFALLIFVYGGFLWLTSAGEAAKIQAGKDAMKWAAIGLVVVFSSYTLVSFVLSTLTKKV